MCCENHPRVAANLARLALVLAVACSKASATPPDRSDPRASPASSDKPGDPESAISVHHVDAGNPPAVIWQGTSGGFDWTWRDSGLSVSRDGGKPRELLHPDPALDSCADAQESYRLVSVVGPLASLEHGTWADCGGAHPSAVTSYEVVDATRPARRTTLLDYFSEADVLGALQADPLVRKALGHVRPATVRELLKFLSGKTGGGDPEGCGYAFSEGMLASFAFHHVEGGAVAVRIGLSHGCEVMRGNLTQLGLLLPIPRTLAANVGAAAMRQEGFLMKDSSAIRGDRATELIHGR